VTGRVGGAREERKVAMMPRRKANTNISEPVVRALEPADVEMLVEIAVAAWTPIYAWYRQAMGEELFAAAFPDWPAEKARQVRSACASPRSEAARSAIVGVAELDGRIAGFVTCYADLHSGIGEIGNNAVRPDVRGRGIGPRMYEYAFARLRERGMRYVKVGTGGDPAHAPARRAYEKAGFDIQLPGVEYYREL
jgi:ribosomal protein S18 acetylase RimI-like enzyme